VKATRRTAVKRSTGRVAARNRRKNQLDAGRLAIDSGIVEGCDQVRAAAMA